MYIHNYGLFDELCKGTIGAFLTWGVNAMLSQYQIDVEKDVLKALIEDLSENPLNVAPDSCDIQSIVQNDITANLIHEDAVAEAQIITRQPAILCGKAWVETAFKLTNTDNIFLNFHFEDGDYVPADSCIVDIKGKARGILTAERTALNFLQFLSATATTTFEYVKHLRNTKVKLLDTRKTIPHFRQAQKYAVACGQGQNHRIGLFDMFLIKENHIQACGGIANAILKARQTHQNIPVEVEVENLDELTQAIEAKADVIMLDNFSLELIRQAVLINNGQCKLEVSGNITQERLKELSNIGIDFISSGAITKNVASIDLSLLIKKIV